MRFFSMLLGVAATMAMLSGTASAQYSDRTMETLSSRLFPVLSAVGQSPELVEDLLVEDRLAEVLERRTEREDTCAADQDCRLQAALWREGELAAMQSALASHADTLEGRGLIADDGLPAAIAREIAGINEIIHVYGLGKEPRYPAIDGPSASLGSPAHDLRVRMALNMADVQRERSVQQLDDSVELALSLLDAHQRLDAAGFPDLDRTENAAAMAEAGSIDWNDYPYTALIVPGGGPYDSTTALEASGKYHVRLAAERYARGLAPLIIVSGGYAHPRDAGFNEAVEMRRALIERHGVPAEAIVIEPFARHTTTNLRNAGRRLMALSAPLDRDALIVCQDRQSNNIEAPAWEERNARELGYQPGTVGRRISPNDLEYRPSITAARVDPFDPLDP